MAGKVGQRKQEAMRPDQARNAIWQSMRRLREFTELDLQAGADASRDNVARYRRALSNAGYLEQISPANPARREGAVYRLIRNTGPVAPRVSKADVCGKGIYDANVEEPIEKHSKRLRRYAPRLLMQLRHIVDAACELDDHGEGLLDRTLDAIAEARELLAEYDGALL